MNYLSPFHILPDGFEAKGLIDKKSLKQARKVLFAEFELQGKTTIFINEQEYDKDAILKFFERLEKDNNLAFHALIFQHKPLLHFLEKGLIKYYPAARAFITAKKYPNADQFILFIAPYVAKHYNQLLLQSLRQNNYDDLFQLVNNEFPLPSQYQSTAYQSAYRWYHQKQRDVEAIEQDLADGEFVSGTRIYELIEPGFIHNFNQMPLYFFEIRDKYAFKLYEIIVLLNNKYKRTELARSILDAGILLDVDHRTHEYFTNADGVIDKKTKKTKRKSWLWLYVILQLVFIIFRISTCNNSSSSFDYKKNHLHIPNNFGTDEVQDYIDIMPSDTRQAKKRFDSLIKSLERYNDLDTSITKEPAKVD